jgi:hypothetical protein
MNKKIIIPFLALLLFSCEKISDSEILKFYGDAYEDIGYSVARSEAGYLIAAQYTSIARNGREITGSRKKMALITTDLNGIEIRKDTLGDKYAASGIKVISMEDGSSVIAGYIVDPVTSKDVYVVKVAPNGEGYTKKTYRLAGNQYATDIIKIASGYVILGTTDVARGSGDNGNTQGKKDIFMILTNEALDTLRTYRTGYTGDDEGIILKQATDGSYIVVGTTDRSYQGQAGTNIFILNVGSDLAPGIPNKILGGVNNEYAADFEILKDGLLIVGTTEGAGNSRSGHVWKTSGITGPVTEEHQIQLDPSTSESFSINAICRYKTNSFLMAGQYGSASSGSMLIFTTDQNGYFTGNTKIAGGTGNQVAYDVISDGDDIVAVGKNSYESNSMITLLKFRF